MTDLFPTHLLYEGAVGSISPQQAVEEKMFGPMYHGTQGDLAAIIASGFDPNRSVPSHVDHWGKPVGSSNGYSLEPYGFSGIAAPVHHLGFASYFSFQKATAKKFAGGTAKGMRTFYLASQNVLEINFGSPNTMMRWWRENGYDMTPQATKNLDVQAWVAATRRLTETLSSKYDAVHFLGKGMRRLLDGDQVAVYHPELIRVLDPKMAGGLEIGAKIMATSVVPDRYKGKNVFYLDDLKPTDFGGAGKLAGQGWRAIFRADGDPEAEARIGRYPVHFIPPKGMVGLVTPRQGNGRFSIKWAKGGEMYNYEPSEIEPFTGGKK